MVNLRCGNHERQSQVGVHTTRVFVGVVEHSFPGEEVRVWYFPENSCRAVRQFVGASESC